MMIMMMMMMYGVSEWLEDRKRNWYYPGIYMEVVRKNQEEILTLNVPALN
jgi:hypothetical protein